MKPVSSFPPLLSFYLFYCCHVYFNKTFLLHPLNFDKRITITATDFSVYCNFLLPIIFFWGRGMHMHQKAWEFAAETSSPFSLKPNRYFIMESRLPLIWGFPGFFLGCFKILTFYFISDLVKWIYYGHISNRMNSALQRFYFQTGALCVLLNLQQMHTGCNFYPIILFLAAHSPPL